MVSLRTIARILLEGIGEFMIIVSVLIYSSQYPISWIPSIEVIGLVLIGVFLRVYADELYSTIRDGKLKKRLFHWEK